MMVFILVFFFFWRCWLLRNNEGEEESELPPQFLVSEQGTVVSSNTNSRSQALGAWDFYEQMSKFLGFL